MKLSSSKLAQLCSSLLIWASCCAGLAQNSAAHVDVRPFAPTSSSGIDSVSQANGSLAVNIPLWSFKQRGSVALNFWLAYESPTFASLFDCTDSASEVRTQAQEKQAIATNLTWAFPGDHSQSQGPPNSVANPNAKGPSGSCTNYPNCPAKTTPQVVCMFNWDWAFLGPDVGLPWVSNGGNKNVGIHLATSTDVLVVPVIIGTYPNSIGYYWKVNTPDGGAHRLAKVNGASYFRASDGSGWLYTPSSCELRDEKGGLYVFTCINTTDGNKILGSKTPGLLQSVEDLDGNRITLHYDSNSLFLGWTDSIGRTIDSPDRGSAGDTSTCPSSSDTASVWYIPGVANSFTFCGTDVAIHTGLLTSAGKHNPQSYELQDSYHPISRVILPSGDKWSFTYGAQPGDALYGKDEAYGDLAKITLPTGGFIQYHWSRAQAVCGANPGGSLARSQIQSRDVSDGVSTATWSYVTGTTPDLSQQTATVTDPSGATVTKYLINFGGCNIFSKKEEYRDSAGTLLKTASREFEAWPANYQLSLDFMLASPMPSADYTTWADGISKAVAYAHQPTFPTLGYDNQTVVNLPFGKETSRNEYGYFAGSTPSSADLQNRVPLRTTDTAYRFQSDTNAQTWNDLASVSSETTTDNSSGEKRSVSYSYSVSALPGGSAPSQNGNAVTWDASPANGNFRAHPTSITRSGKSGSLSSTAVYTNTGMLSSETLPHDSTTPDTTTTYGYAAASQGAVPTTMTDAAGHATTVSYDAVTLQPLSVTDPNTNVTTYTYYGDSRLHTIGFPDGGSKTYSYSSTQVSESTKRDSANKVDMAVLYDGLGRQSQSSLASACADGSGVSVETTYDLLGRVSTVSNPHCQGDTVYTTTSGYDGLDRLVSFQNQDGSTRTNQYNQREVDALNDSVTSLDERNNKVSRISDALGRPIGVVETLGSSSLGTIYTNDVFGALTGVLQTGTGTEAGRSRQFTYDSFGRLITSLNPETGMICYGRIDSSGTCSGGYDAHGNLLAKTDARGHVVSYDYDALNRMLHKYAGGSLQAEYWYDGGYPPPAAAQYNDPQPNVIGRLNFIRSYTPTSYGQDDQYYAYDEMGRLKFWLGAPPSERDRTYHTVRAGYDLAGNITSLKYPDGRGITQTFDGAGRLYSVAEDGGATFVNSIAYQPNDTPKEMHFSNGNMGEYTSLNSRLQVCETRVGNGGGASTMLDRQYFHGSDNTAGNQCASAAGNNGNIFHIGDIQNSQLAQHYSYDSLNRLTGWTGANQAGTYRHQSFGYDAFGNLTQSSSQIPVSASDVYGPDNRFLASAFNCVGHGSETGGYDSAGNILCTGSSSAMDQKQFVWDQESRLSQFWNQQHNNPYLAGIYSYDGTGQRIRTDNPTAGTWREYSYFNGLPLAEKDQDGNWTDHIYANGRRIATIRPTTVLHHSGVCGNCGGGASNYHIPQLATELQGYTLRAGDVLVFQQKQTNARAGLYMIATDGTNSMCGLVDQAGDCMNSSSQADGTWKTRVVDLSSWAGKQVSTNIGVSVEGTTQQALAWDSQIADAAVVSTDGQVHTMYHGQPVTGTAWGPGADSYWGTGAYFSTEQLAGGNGRQSTTVTVRFTNDACSCMGNAQNGDRNLYVSEVSLGGVSADLGGASYTGVRGGPGELLGTGDMTVTLAGTGQVTVKAHGSPADGIFPHMQVLLNGALAGEWDLPYGEQTVTVGSSATVDTAVLTTYFAGDQVGTVAMEFANNAWPVQRTEFAPFGQELSNPTLTNNRYKFTGKERDAESGLDYFGARYYGSSMGRFMSPDWADKPEAVPYSQLENPQSLNLYSYVKNNPLSQADGDGHCDWCHRAWQATKQSLVQAGRDWIAGVHKIQSDLHINGPSDPDLAIKSVATTMSVVAVVPEFGGSVEVNANAAGAEVEVAPVAAEVESVAASASRLAGETGQNSAEFQTETSVGRIDLTGKAHYDKATGTKIETPHVHEQQIHTSPTGQTNLGAKTTRSATSADVEKARQIIKKDPQ